MSVLNRYEDSKEWFQSIGRVISRTHWKEDILRGLQILKTGSALISDRSFAETELFRLRRQVDQVDEELAQTFQSLGKRSMEHWESQQVLNEKEKTRIFNQIEVLKKEKQEKIEKMETLKWTSDHTIQDESVSTSSAHNEPPPSSIPMPKPARK